VQFIRLCCWIWRLQFIPTGSAYVYSTLRKLLAKFDKSFIIIEYPFSEDRFRKIAPM